MMNLDNTKILHLTKKNLSDINYDIIHFPDGEIQLDIKDSLVNFKQKIMIVTRVCNGDDLFLLLQAQDILERHCIAYEVTITYLMTQRSDRLFSLGRPFSLGIVANLLKGDGVYVLEPHNYEAIQRLTSQYIWSLNYEDRLESYYVKTLHKDTMIMFPDAGAQERYEPYNPDYNWYVVGEKVHDVATGKIIDYQIKQMGGGKPTIPDSVKQIIIVDDLCDGGRTFLTAWQKLKELAPNAKICLDVVHAVQEEGLRAVCSAFDEVTVTNSYDDWEELGFKNLKVNDVQDIKKQFDYYKD
jgi:ribose-phosphate pyrophosphokinase